MSRSNPAGRATSIRRLIVITIVLVPIVPLTMMGVLEIHSRLASWVYWEAAVVFLVALEAAYGIAAAATILGTLSLAVLLVRSRESRRIRLAAARGLLLCGSLWLVFGVAEGGVAIWKRRWHRDSAAEAAGAAPVPSSGFSRGLPAPWAKVEGPTRFPDPPGDREIDIAVLGESSAEGVPYNRWVSVGQLVAWRLREVFPGRPVRVNILAQSGETLELQQARLGQLNRRPEVFIIYCGHNEFSSRFHHSREPRYYLDDAVPTAWDLLVDGVETASPVCGLIRRTADRCRVAIPPPPDGHRALVDVPVCTAAESTALLVDFRRRLDALVAYAGRIGALPVLIPPPANDAGFEPNRSCLPAATPRGERAAFARAFLEARGAEDTDPARARDAYRALLARQPGFAEAHHRLARLLERSGDWEEAYRHDVAARDADGYPMRCPTAFQEVYREVAARRGCILVDGQALFHAVGRHGLLDDGLFHDGMHPSLRGQIALAQGVLHELKARGALGWPKDSPEPVLDPARCVRQFGLGPAEWHYLCLWGIMFYDRTWPIRYDPAHRKEMKRVFADAADRIQAGEPPEAVGLPNIGTPEPVPALNSIPRFSAEAIPPATRRASEAARTIRRVPGSARRRRSGTSADRSGPRT